MKYETKINVYDHENPYPEMTEDYLKQENYTERPRIPAPRPPMPTLEDRENAKKEKEESKRGVVIIQM